MEETDYYNQRTDADNALRIRRDDEPRMSHATYRMYARNADLLLFRPTSIYGRVIAAVTHSKYSHVESVMWWADADRLMSCGYDKGGGGAARPLSALVAQYPGKIDVYRVRTRAFADAGGASIEACVTERLAADLGYAYRWRIVGGMALSLIPVIRWVMKSCAARSFTQRVAMKSRAGICSQHVARSFAACGIDIVPEKYPHETTPADIADAPLTEYMGTLIGVRDMQLEPRTYAVL